MTICLEIDAVACFAVVTEEYAEGPIVLAMAHALERDINVLICRQEPDAEGRVVWATVQNPCLRDGEVQRLPVRRPPLWVLLNDQHYSALVPSAFIPRVQERCSDEEDVVWDPPFLGRFPVIVFCRPPPPHQPPPSSS